jgi:hypothetical protein
MRADACLQLVGRPERCYEVVRNEGRNDDFLSLPSLAHGSCLLVQLEESDSGCLTTHKLQFLDEDGERVAEVFFDPMTCTGYGNHKKDDVLLVKWDIPRQKLIILVLAGCSQKGVMDWLWHERFLAGGVKGLCSIDNCLLNTAPVSAMATGDSHG